MDVLLLAVVIILAVNWIHYLICLLRQSRFEGRWLLPGTWVGFVGLSIYIILHTVELSRSLLESPSSLLLIFGWSILAVYLILLASFPLKAMGSLVLPTALLFIAIPVLPFEVVHWGSWVHVLLILLGYGTFTVSFLLGLGYLQAERQLQSKNVDHYLFMLPSLEALDSALQRTIWIGLGCLITGIVLGIIDGVVTGTIGLHWLYDPNVMGAMVTALIYGTIAWMRSSSLFTNRRIVFMTIAGFILIVLLFLGMNYFSKMHQFV